MSTFGSNSADIEDGSSKQQRSATSEEIDTADEIRLNESIVRKRACSSKTSDIEDGDSERQPLATFEVIALLGLDLYEEIFCADKSCLNESTIRKIACSDIEDGAIKLQRLAPEDEDDSSAEDEDDSSAEDVDSSTDYVNLSPQEKEKLKTSTDYVNLSSQEKEKLNTSTDYVNLIWQEKEKLNTFFEEIITTAGVDFSNPEIQDIQRAVSEMIGRIKTRINERGFFSISRTELCGSMAEKTAMWKFNVVPKIPFIEFDFLAVLQAACDIEVNCQECFLPVDTLQANLELLIQYYRSSYNSYLNYQSTQNMLKECFTKETNDCLASCGCLEVQYSDSDSDIMELLEYTFKPSSICSKTQQGCCKCTVDKPTGTLRVKTSAKIGGFGEADCSLIFDWTSKAKTLRTRNRMNLPETEKMDNITIHIDFLPALELFQSKQQSADVAACSSSDLVLNPTSSEYEHYCFLVPKYCAVCDEDRDKDTWRRSGCRAEIDTIVNKMSDKHRRCYQVLKYFIEFTEIKTISGYINNYQLKVAVLHHNRSCSDTSEDCAECVFKVIDELQHAYRTKHLKSLHSQANLLEQVHYCDYSPDHISALGKAMCSAVRESGLLPLPSFMDKVRKCVHTYFISMDKKNLRLSAQGLT